MQTKNQMSVNISNMITITPNDDFKQEMTCTYKDELYSVRDNGAVLRHQSKDGKVRPNDNKWTFGKPNPKTGYMEIVSKRVHIIVSMAYHGEPPTKSHVVDHIDTNRRNNRPENLRWVTRLENMLLNPITAKRIEIICGSIEAFLADPSKFRDKFPEPNYEWMCTVTSQEAKNTLKRLEIWAKNDRLPSGGKLGDWIIERNDGYTLIEDYKTSLTPNVLQRKWLIPSEFPCCPESIINEPLKIYSENLKSGSIFCQNEKYTSLVLKSSFLTDEQTIYVLSESTQGKHAGKPWALAKITFEKGKFIHTSLGNYFSQDGAEKQYCLAQGLEWTGANSIDDYC